MVRRIVKKSQNMLFNSQGSILSAAAIISITSVFSSILGLIKVRLLNTYFPSDITGIFFTADQIPSFVLNIIVIGAMSSSFIPIFARYLDEKKEDEAWKITSVLLNLSSLALLVFIVLILLFTRSFIEIFPFTRHASAAQLAILEDLLRIMMVPQILLLISSFFTNVLQSFKRFLIPALAPVLYNLGVIISLILFSDTLGIYAAAWGMLLGAFMHLMVQVPLIRNVGFRYIPSLNIRHAGVSRVFKLFAPRTLGLAAHQLSTFLDTTIFASYIAFATVTAYTLANHLQAFPVIFFGMAIGQAAFPTLVALASKKRMNDFKTTLSTSLLQLMFLVMPVAVMMIVLRVPLVRLVFGGEKFSWMDTLVTGYTLSFFALSIFAQCAVQILSRAFYALENTWTPVKFSLTAVSVSLILSYLFIYEIGLGVWSLALSYSIGSFINMTLLLFALQKTLGKDWLYSMLRPFLKIGYSAFFLAMLVYVPVKYLDEVVVDTTRTFNLILLTGIVSTFALGWYLVLTYFVGVKEVNLFWKIVKKFSYFKKSSV